MMSFLAFIFLTGARQLSCPPAILIDAVHLTAILEAVVILYRRARPCRR